MDVQAIRTALKIQAPDGWTPYDHLPGAAMLPALVVGLPDRITLKTASLFELELPLILVVATPYSPEGEGRLLTAAIEAAAAYKGLTGDSFRSCTWTSIDRFVSVTVGRIAATAAHVNLTIIA